MPQEKSFLTIRETAKTGLVSEHYLRLRLKQGKLPGFYVGTRYRVDYGWVKLTDAQYNKLLDDLGEAELKRCIQYVDERAQLTGNKSRYKDWNLALRNCNRGGWGKNQFSSTESDRTEEKVVAWNGSR